MRQSLKIILYLLTASIVVILVAVLCLPFIINPNDFKAQIETVVKKQTGRTLTIKGDLKLSIFPWLGLSTGQIILSNAPGFNDQPFAQIQHSEIKIKLIPLLSKQLDVSEIIFKGLQLHLSKNKQGINNWDDLKPLSKDDSKMANPLAILTIAGLLIDNATITWDDLQTNQHSEIKNMHIEVGKLALNHKVPLKLSLKLINQQPSLTQLVNLSGNLIIDSSLEIFQLQNLQVKLANTSVLIPTKSLTIDLFTDALFNKSAQHLHLSKLKINSGAFNFSADVDGYFKEPAKMVLIGAIANFNLATFLDKMKIKLPKMRDENALTALKLGFKLQANTEQVKINNLRLKVDETWLKGSIQITHFLKPLVQFDLAIDKINLDRYLPPKNKPKNITSPTSIAAIGLASVPIKMLRKLNSTGQIAIEQLKFNDLTMQGVTLKLEAKKGIVQSNQAINQFYKGDYQGSFNLDANRTQPVFSLNEHFNNIHIAPLLNDINANLSVQGLLNVDAQLTGQGNTEELIKSSLKGQLRFLLKEAVIKGFTVQKILNNQTLAIEGKNVHSRFSKISASVRINQGLIQNEDLFALSPKIKLTGQGQANLITEKLNYQFKALRIKQSATTNNVEVLSRQPIIINVAGTFDKPHYSANVAAMLLKKHKNKIDKVLNKFDKKMPAKLEKFLKNIL